MTRSKNTPPNGAAIRNALGHPVIDSDAHVVECEFALVDTLKEVAGAKSRAGLMRRCAPMPCSAGITPMNRRDANSALAARRSGTFQPIRSTVRPRCFPA